MVVKVMDLIPTERVFVRVCVSVIVISTEVATNDLQIIPSEFEVVEIVNELASGVVHVLAANNKIIIFLFVCNLVLC